MSSQLSVEEAFDAFRGVSCGSDAARIFLFDMQNGYYAHVVAERSSKASAVSFSVTAMTKTAKGLLVPEACLRGSSWHGWGDRRAHEPGVNESFMFELLVHLAHQEPHRNARVGLNGQSVRPIAVVSFPSQLLVGAAPRVAG